MTHYSHIPMVRILLPVLAGIIFFTYIEHFLSLRIILVVLLAFLASGIVIYKYLLSRFHLGFVYGLNVMLLLFFAGYVLAQSRYELRNPSHFSHHTTEASMLHIRLIEPVAEKTNSFQVVGRVTHIISENGVQVVSGKIILWLEKSPEAQSLQYGDVIMVENHYQETREPQNPNSFNYKHFLSRQNIFHQSYRRTGEWYPTGRNEGNRIVSSAHTMRQKALETLEANNIKGRDFAVASALLLGYREYLDEDLQREFAGAGAMHILCVSGLHVGIIFLALNVMFGFLTRLRGGKYMKTVVIIALIWFYAAITGFAPSVMRASTMFSFVAVGQTFRRSTNIYNTLAASALMLVMINPFIVSRIGFQLSYIAVISIVSLQPLFYKQLYFKNKILDHGWGIITVSLAAQLGTGPMALFYFNQFPNYFLLTNLIVIPLTGLIIKGGLLLFFSAPVAFVSQYFGIVLSWIVWTLHTAVRMIEGLPGSTANSLVIGFHDKLLIFILISVAGLVWMKKQKKLVLLLMVGLLLLSTSFSTRHFVNQNRKQLVVYHVPNGTAVDIFHQGNCYFYGCENVLNNPGTILFNVRDHRLKSGFRASEPILLSMEEWEDQKLFVRNGFINVAGHSARIIDGQLELPSQRFFPDTLDHLIIRGNPRWSLSNLMDVLPARTIVFDNSNHLRHHRRWKEECDSLGINCWSVALQGAYVYNFDNKQKSRLISWSANR
ncbi:MAG: ComEC family competence protein [Bacteroidetes bacterium]|nr:MAG: ComEC family competence protein [Bacteroidota bacterium]